LTPDLSFLDLSPKNPVQKWTPAKVVIFGAERYVMISVDAEVHINFVKGGFETKFREPFAIPSELLLGSSFRRTKIFDIEIRIGHGQDVVFVMSMAKMHPNKFPRAVGEGELVGING
jgi:hypothetical protein